MVDYSFDPQDYQDRYYDDRRDRDRIEQMMIDAMRDIDRDTRPMPVPNRPDPVQEVINNPSITLTAPEIKAINDPKKVMDNQGRIVSSRSRARSPSGRDVIRSSGQFANRGIPLPPVKRTRKKTKMDKTMSTCLKMANKRMRKKNGQLRKGKTMRDVMRLAHRLCKKS
ncbi:MAG: hypothetical protein [Circular genetic element sp.]|nr:MAG: hypothetical protein [Circular genetic element sp.]